MKAKDKKDMLREFIKMQLPGLRKTSLNTEVEILDDFVEQREAGNKEDRYSSQFQDKTDHPGYHLDSLKRAGALIDSDIEGASFILDIAEENPKQKAKRTRQEIRDARELRVRKLIEHAENDESVNSIVCDALCVDSLEESEEEIIYSEDYSEEKENHKAYNELVRVIKEAGIELDGYDEIVWRNPKKPWNLDTNFISYLKGKGFDID